ncbi:hypothetical protein F2Q70_00017742 [Brassica cretica]|uniref:Uncharacterized protein n=1 Tax=Brassica cretica TaxID=69181 RepID=A0A8S9I3A9_BRACR|nr:hypothetical protein F2Q70_00017742 [Brassica cretica]
MESLQEYEVYHRLDSSHQTLAHTIQLAGTKTFATRSQQAPIRDNISSRLDQHKDSSRSDPDQLQFAVFLSSVVHSTLLEVKK